MAVFSGGQGQREDNPIPFGILHVEGKGSREGHDKPDKDDAVPALGAVGKYGGERPNIYEHQGEEADQAGPQRCGKKDIVGGDPRVAGALAQREAIRLGTITVER